jgi:GAF domain-containing protein
LSQSAPTSLFAIISEELEQLENLLHRPAPPQRAAPTPEHASLAHLPGPASGTVDEHEPADEALELVRDLRRRVDKVYYLYDTNRRLSLNLPLREALDLIVDTVWPQQCNCVVVLLGETELGPYFYQEMRGVVDPRRFVGKQCPLPLWGELAHALVRRLDPDEADYLIIGDIAASGRPKPEEFPWLERHGSLMIVPLRKDSIAMGALILGRRDPNGFDDPELCAQMIEIAGGAAMALYHAQVRQELQDRADQLVGLQLFTRSLRVLEPFPKTLDTILNGVADLLGTSEVFLLLLRRELPDDLNCLHSTLEVRVPWADLCVIGNLPPGNKETALPNSLYRLVMWTIEAGQALFLNPHQEFAAPEDLYYNGVGHALLVPIASGDDAIGAIYAVALEGHPDFDESDMVVTRTMANMAAAVMELSLTLYRRPPS